MCNLILGAKGRSKISKSKVEQIGKLRNNSLRGGAQGTLAARIECIVGELVVRQEESVSLRHRVREQEVAYQGIDDQFITRPLPLLFG